MRLYYTEDDFKIDIDQLHRFHFWIDSVHNGKIIENKESKMLKKIEVFKDGTFDDKAMNMLLVHDSPYMKVINFNFKAGQALPVHSHEIEGQLSIVVLEGSGQFLGKDESSISARPGDVLISDIAEPHGIKADTDMRVLVTIAPPI